MTSPLPTDADSYKKAIQSMGNKFVPLSQLVSTKSGSDWALPELLAFRVLVKDHRNKRVPAFLEGDVATAQEKLLRSPFYTNLIEILAGNKWRRSNYNTILGLDPEFGGFLRTCAEVVQKPLSTLKRRRSVRTLAKTGPYASVNSSQSTDGAGTGEKEIANKGKQEGPEEDDNDKKMQTESHSSDSESSGGDFEDDATARSQEKQEGSISIMIVTLIDRLVRCASLPADRKFQLAWEQHKPIRFRFRVPQGQKVSTTNDGALICRLQGANRVWARHPSLLCYCSIEAKAAYFQAGKPHKVYAQEASQIIGMIHQREKHATAGTRPKEDHRVIPLISVSQEHVWVVFAKYTDSYYDFLCTGNFSQEEYLVLEQYGPFNITNVDQFKTVSNLFLGLHLFLEGLGELP